jgi:2-polyprenyl-6-methoxyphenol hydroxylase-like FAD-dependent oxidoreductase
MLLARKGYRVKLVDRASFPSDTMSTHYIHQPGIARLQAWGLLDRVIASNCPALREIVMDLGEFRLRGAPPACGQTAFAYAPRRRVLDSILVEAAQAAGAELCMGFSVKGVLRDGDSVVGVRGVTGDGRAVSERARLVIGADGRNSLIARSVGAAQYQERPALTCAYYSYFSGMALDCAELHLRPGLCVVAFPTNDARVLVAVIRPAGVFTTWKHDIESGFMAGLDELPELARRVRLATRAERFIGTADMPNFFRKPFGPGWALVGDAGYHKDPLTGQGISDALCDAERLAAAVDAGLSGRADLAAALAAYEQARNDAHTPIYDFTCTLAALAPPAPDLHELFRALRGNQKDTNRLLGVLAGTVSMGDFFAPENVARIKRAAAGSSLCAAAI